MIFPKRQDFLAPRVGNPLGTILQFELTREFMIDSLMVRALGTYTTAAATANADGALNLVRRITLTVNDGPRQRTVVDCSGVGLIELARCWNLSLDRATQASAALAIGAGAPTAFEVCYPIYFNHPQCADPLGSTMLLPTSRFNANPVLTVYLATQADMDQNAAPGFAMAAGITVSVTVNRRQVTIPDWPVLDTEILEGVVTYAGAGAGQLYELSTPGAYTGLLLRPYVGAAGAVGRADPTPANGEFRLQVLQTVLRRGRYLDIQRENDMSVTVSPSATGTVTAFQNIYWDFLSDKCGEAASDLGSVLDVNGLVKTGARAQVLQDLAANVTMRYVWHRVFGNLSAFRRGFKAG